MQSDKETNLNSRDYDAVDSDAVSLERRVRSNLRRVIDPEIGINIVDLGLVYDIDIQDKDVTITHTLTSMFCPFGDMIMMESEFAIRSTEGVNLIKLNLTFDPPWNPDIHVSDEAKYQMGIL